LQDLIDKGGRILEEGEALLAEVNDVKMGEASLKHDHDEANRPSQKVANPANENHPSSLWSWIPKKVHKEIGMQPKEDCSIVLSHYLQTLFDQLPTFHQQNVMKKTTYLQCFNQMVLYIQAEREAKEIEDL
jgi:hypothetical protein